MNDGKMFHVNASRFSLKHFFLVSVHCERNRVKYFTRKQNILKYNVSLSALIQEEYFCVSYLTLCAEQNQMSTVTVVSVVFKRLNVFFYCCFRKLR